MKYKTFRVPLGEKNVVLELHTCEDCGALVGDRTKHNSWHINRIGSLISASDPRTIGSMINPNQRY